MRRLLVSALLASTFVAARPVARALEGYADEVSYTPGATVALHISALGTYRIELVRFGAFTDPFDAPDALVTFQGAPPTVQQTDFGSFVETPLHELPRTNLTVEAWVYLTTDAPPYQTIVSQMHTPNEEAMSVGVRGPSRQIEFYLSGAGAACSTCTFVSINAVPLRAWTHVTATYDGAYKRIYINGVLDSEQAYTDGIAAIDEPVRIAASATDAGTVQHFNGKLDGVALYDAALTTEQIAARISFGLLNPRAAPLQSAMFQYDFEEGYGQTVIDSTRHRLTASLPNGGARGVSGPGAVGPAIRFAEEDFVDARWPITDSIEIPSDWASGLYAARVIENESGASMYIMFVVRPTASRAPIAVIASTNTWNAYNQWPGSVGGIGTGAYSMHRDGSPNYFIPTRRPNPAADPYALNDPPTSYGHLVYAERFLHSWLEHEGRSYDLYSDLDLHEGRIPLGAYKTVVLVAHSEYWSEEMRARMFGFLDHGGNIVSLSGNTMYWKVTFDADRSVMEVRKWAGPAGQPDAPIDERTHAQTNERGGLWGILLRAGEYDDYDLLGVAFDSMTVADGGASAFAVSMPEHWAFAGLGLSVGSRIGAVSRNGMSALGHESDASNPVLSPPGVQVLARGTGVNGVRVILGLDDVVQLPPTTEAGEITAWNRPQGGSVFAVGSIAAAGGLGVDGPLTGAICRVLSRYTSREDEVCDGVDNDCDGVKDDNARCDDGNECTEDSGDCAKGTCEYVPIPGCVSENDAGGGPRDGNTDTAHDDGNDGCGCSAPGEFPDDSFSLFGILLASILFFRALRPAR